MLIEKILCALGFHGPKWWRMGLQRIGFWLAEKGGYAQPTSGYRQATVETWVRQDGKYHHIAVIPATRENDGSVYFNGVKGSVPSSNSSERQPWTLATTEKHMTKAEEAFKKWYFEDGADWNAAHIKPVWIAAWNAAKEAAAQKVERTVIVEGCEKEIAADIRSL